MKNINLIEARLKAGFKKATHAAEHFGWNVNTYRSHENGNAVTTEEFANIYAEKFGVDNPAILLSEGREKKIIKVKDESQSLPIRFKSQAGAWFEIEDNQEIYGLSKISADPRFPKTEQWAELVIGDSMDKIFPDGSILHVVSFIAAPTLRDGMFAIIERNRRGSIERTVKKIIGKHPNIKIVGVSHNEKWNKPIDLELLCDEFESAQIVGVVIGGYHSLI